MVELDVAGLAAHGLGVEVGQDKAGIPAVRQANVLRREDRKGEVAVPADKLVLLWIAVRQSGLDQRSGQEADLAGREGVLLVEEECLPDQTRRPASAPLNRCRMKL